MVLNVHFELHRSYHSTKLFYFKERNHKKERMNLLQNPKGQSTCELLSGPVTDHPGSAERYNPCAEHPAHRLDLLHSLCNYRPTQVQQPDL
jgi:hypothetical protein